ncbi:MAG: creatininase family protein [Alphaproteobacteria bacterium]|nr:creatininase family protein [Alphaproteobacteria bacterium]
MQLQLSTWAEVEAYLRTSTGILVPIGSTEQHGPNGLIGTDAITAEMIARRAGELVAALVAPTISVGLAEHHMAFPGSMTLLPATLTAVIEDYAASLARHGFRHLYFVNGHGGNIGLLRRASEALNGRAEGPRCRFVNWWLAPRTKALRETLYGERDGQHATPSELSVVWFTHPTHERPAPALPVAPPMQRWEGAAHYRAMFPDGRIGSDPQLASAEHGARLCAAAAEDIAEDYRTFIAAG